MAVFQCVICHAVFTRKAHLLVHSGSKRCTLNVAVAGNSVLKRPARRLATHARGISGKGNVRRRLKIKAVPFIKYLKSNIKHCKQAAEAHCNMRLVDVVPFSPEYSPRDIAQLALGIKRQGYKKWWLSSSRVSLVAATLAAGHMFTEAGVAAIGWPPFPWSDAYAMGLRRRLLNTVSSGTHFFCYRFTSISTQSFLGLPAAEVPKAVDAFVDVIEDCVRVAATAVANAKLRVAGLSSTHADDFYADIGHKGMPARGYSMHLSQCIWSYGGIAEGVYQCDDGIFPADTQTSVFHSNQAGTCIGLARVTGDEEAHLKNSLALQKLRLLLLPGVVAKLWPVVGGRVSDPFAKLGDVARAGCLANQLCEWTKARIYYT